MNNADKPAYPVLDKIDNGTVGGMAIFTRDGLTKREYFAAMAMQAFITCNDRTENKSFVGITLDSEEIAGLSIVYADELLKQLDNKTMTSAKLISKAPDLLQLCEEMKEALMQTMPYVEGAYECAFPDESENEYVMYKAKSAIAKFNELFKD